MQNTRRSFLKKTLGVGAVVAVGGVNAIASSQDSSASASNGVVVGKAHKKEILYKKTANWEAYYKASY